MTTGEKDSTKILKFFCYMLLIGVHGHGLFVALYPSWMTMDLWSRIIIHFECCICLWRHICYIIPYLFQILAVWAFMNIFMARSEGFWGMFWRTFYKFGGDDSNFANMSSWNLAKNFENILKGLGHGIHLGNFWPLNPIHANISWTFWYFTPNQDPHLHHGK
jgi:hypothetical protein